MKNKWFIALLVGVVLMIWGSILFRIKKIQQPNRVVSTVKEQITSEFTYLDYFEDKELSLNYKEPFNISERTSELNRNNTSSSRSVSRIILPPKRVEPPKKPEVKKTKEIINWPDIIINGVITSKIHNEKNISLRVDDQQMIVKVGDKIKKDFTIQHVDKDSIYLRYKLKNKGYALE